MSNFTASRSGQQLGAGDAKANFEKVFSGEVLTAFNTANIMMDKHQVRTISHGKSASFPLMGKNTAAYHTPGTEIDGNEIEHAELEIFIDDLLISPVFIANIDEAMNHYEVRAEYSKQCGESLALEADQKILQTAILAARASANLTGGDGGATITEGTATDFATDGAKIAEALYTAAQTLDEKNVSATDRAAYFKPAQYYLLPQSTGNINRDWNGAGSFADGTIKNIAGIPIFKTNNLPQTNVTTGPATYQGDFSKVKGLVMQRAAVGTVKLLDLATESDYSVRHQGTLMVAKYAMGHGILRPECAVELLSQ